MTSMRSRNGPGNGVEHVRGGDEHHAAQVERHGQIVVAERAVLLGVEHLEQRSAGIAVDAGAELVDLVEHHHAVARAGLADRLDDVAGQRTDVGAPVPADLGLVVHAAEADAHELAAHGTRDRLAERGLAHAGRADQAQDRCLALGRELAHGQILDDPPLDLVEAVVVLIEDAPRLGDVDRRFLRQAPGQLDQPVEIAAHHAVLGGGFRHPLEPAQLLARLLLHLLWHLRLGDGLAELGDLGLALIALAELTADGRQLLAQQHLALALVDGGLRLSADLMRQSQDLDALRQHARDLLDARGHIDRLEDLLLLLRLHIHVSGGEVRQSWRAM